MKAFSNLSEAVRYHRQCHSCGGAMHHNMVIGNDPERPVFKWNLSESIDSECDDWIVVNAFNNQIDYLQQTKRVNDEIIYQGTDVRVVDRFVKYAKNLRRNFNGTLYESIHMDCGRCHQFNYTIKVVIDMVGMKLDGIFLDSEFISYTDSDGIVHRLGNLYSYQKTEYSFRVEPTEEYDGSLKHMSVPIIPLDLCNPAETVARVKKLVIFS